MQELTAWFGDHWHSLVWLALLLFWLLMLLRLLMRRASFGSGGGSYGHRREPGYRMPSGQRTPAGEARAAEQEAAAAEKVREVLRGDKRLVARMLRKAGVAHGPLQDVSDSREDVLRIARGLPPHAIETFWLAATQKDVALDLKRSTDRVPGNFPTGDIEPEPMRSMAQLPDIMPEQLLMSDDQFYRAFAEQQLMVMQPYERKDVRKRLYILLDVSSSMSNSMADGRPRHVWARGVTVNLLLEALSGDAEYFLRPFDGGVHPLRQALTPDEADAMIDHVLERGFSGNGTDIHGALKVACRDIRERKSAEVGASDVLIISDGEDSSMDDTARVRALLGSDIRLHVVQIGGVKGAIKEVATTYRSLL